MLSFDLNPFASIFTIATVMASNVVYRNPIVPGFSPDPSVVLVDGIYYLVTSSFHVFPGLPIYASRDLKEWKHIGECSYGLDLSSRVSDK